MNMKKRVLEYFAPRAVIVSLLYALLWSVVDFMQGGL